MKKTLLMLFALGALALATAVVLRGAHKRAAVDWSSLIIRNPDNIPSDTIARLEELANAHATGLGRNVRQRIVRIEKEQMPMTFGCDDSQTQVVVSVLSVELAENPQAWHGDLIKFLECSNGWRNVSSGSWTQ